MRASERETERQQQSQSASDRDTVISTILLMYLSARDQCASYVTEGWSHQHIISHAFWYEKSVSEIHALSMGQRKKLSAQYSSLLCERKRQGDASFQSKTYLGAPSPTNKEELWDRERDASIAA